MFMASRVARAMPVAVASLVLAGCVSVAPPVERPTDLSGQPAASPLVTTAVPTPSSQSSSSSANGLPTDAATPPTPRTGPMAVVSIAGVDVDGLHLTVAGYVAGVIQDGGSCVFAVRSAVNGAQFNATHGGISNASSTSCGTVQFPTTDVIKGPWNVTLAYTSMTGSVVTSDPVMVMVP